MLFDYALARNEKQSAKPGRLLVRIRQWGFDKGFSLISSESEVQLRFLLKQMYKEKIKGQKHNY